MCPMGVRGRVGVWVLALMLVGQSEGFNFSAVFGDDMVLQGGQANPSAVYGFGAPPGASVRVTVAAAVVEAAEVVTAVAAPSGEWKAVLKPRPKGPQTFTLTATVAGAPAVTLRRVLFGDVWFCSGQSNMELGMHFTVARNESYAALKAGNYSHLRLFHFDHNPQPAPVYTVNDSVVAGWTSAAAALADGTLATFSAACYYFGERWTEYAAAAGTVVPVGLVESAYGGTMIESWMGIDEQLQCKNITCTSNQSLPFTAGTVEQCLAAGAEAVARRGGTDVYPAYLDGLSASVSAQGAGANAMLYNGMVLPFANMSVAGWLWYQGENNLPFQVGNVLNGDGYACLLQRMIDNWRAVFPSVGPASEANPFGIVTLADSTDEGWGCNVPQMHWAETGNVGYAPNHFLPRTFLATAHDLADPWDDGCMDDANGACCVDTGKAVDPRCNVEHRGWLVQTGEYPGVTEPVTPTMGVTIHPRIKRPIGRRLAQSAWALVSGDTDVAWVGPVLSGCAVETAADGGRMLRIKFNKTLLGADTIALAAYNKTEQASVTWALLDTELPGDADGNYVYANRQPWWGDSAAWTNVDIVGVDGPSIIVQLPATGTVKAIQYGHVSPKGHPQSGHYKVCCGNRDFGTDPCAPESCPLALARGGLPAMPFHAAVVNGKCSCFAPQVCDE